MQADYELKKCKTGCAKLTLHGKVAGGNCVAWICTWCALQDYVRRTDHEANVDSHIEEAA